MNRKEGITCGSRSCDKTMALLVEKALICVTYGSWATETDTHEKGGGVLESADKVVRETQ